MAKPAKAAGVARGQCLCGRVAFVIDVPARWAWHDHSSVSRRAHGAAYATYVGSWRKRFRITAGEESISRFADAATKTKRSFCKRCGTPLIYERSRSPHMVNIPRALFSGRTGRQPLYHVAIEELQEWTYAGEPLVLRFRGSHDIAATSDANLGIKGAPAIYGFQCGFKFEVPMTNSL